MVAKRKYQLNENYFESIDSEDKAYWLGFIAADGCVTKNRNSDVLSIGLNKKDKDHLIKFQKSIETNKPIINVESNNSVSLHIFSKKIVEDLSKLGIFPRKSLNLTWPKCIDLNLENHFLRGYFDGDGCWYIQKNKPHKIRFSLLGTEDILNNSLRVIDFNSKITLKSNIHEIKIWGRLQCKKIYHKLYDNCSIFLERKRNKVCYLENYV